jgi:hypothetical protein
VISASTTRNDAAALALTGVGLAAYGDTRW